MAKTPTKTITAERPAIADVIENVPAPKQAQALVPVSPQPEYTREEKEIIKNTVAKGTSDMELAWFLEVARQLGLSPLAREIHAVRRFDRRQDKYIMTIQTGIDGFRKIADGTGCYAPSDRKPELTYDEKDRPYSITVWVKKFVPVDRSWHEYSATVLWEEMVPYEVKDGQRVIPTMWQKMPYNQLEKCAEAKALRRGFPNKFGGIYVNEEMHRADLEELAEIAESAGARSHTVTHETLQAEKRQRERGTLEVGKEENRGHGKEGFEDHGPVPGTKFVAPAEMKKQDKEAERKAKLETIETTVNRLDAKLKKLTTVQTNENNKARAQKKAIPHEPQPYFIANCAGDISVFIWDKHMFPAVTASLNKKVLWKIERRKSGEKEFLGLMEIVKQNGVEYVVDKESEDWVMVTSLRTQAPAAPDRGETAPVEAGGKLVQNEETAGGDFDSEDEEVF